MSFWNSVKANTLGLLWSASPLGPNLGGSGGTVDPWTLANMREEIEKDTKRALGPKATPQAVKIFTERAQKESEDDLRRSGTHPDQAGNSGRLRMNLIRIGVIAVTVLIGGPVLFYSVKFFILRRKR